MNNILINVLCSYFSQPNTVSEDTNIISHFNNENS
ncbi:hypothetical protein Barb6XT_02757 [Bacteroidales bacterium Barb6XT]|nr:hypothetical protein Barb6XT_02757 [Bacteroidales bacterium Barb6XT]